MKELLIVKAGSRYLRFLPQGHQLCSFDKASVFPLDQVVQVLERMHRAIGDGAADIELRKLTIIEEPYAEAM
ncbi:hypothetical protein JWG42_12625 [Desulfoprunum benzoelyticum]|uniref:Uncharacterized protein n=1 Tax=Desulfoprunum benzoelyticum TaxID=1506996 RepID=A0A840V0Q0_9BACT|nr:hypothetical protein [Desulfoprunum benzoelyticum]MBB5349254.1 hypothetical protein [Desulfoprunum benzoelyticum]MBM9530996.1 hypothetical protein [Desulfoprunum benzoelyticum]